MEAEGNYNQLLNSGIDFASLLDKADDDSQPNISRSQENIMESLQEPEVLTPKPIRRLMSIDSGSSK